jgi:hypothetical protein
MKLLQNELPCSADVLFVFYDFQTTQDTKASDLATVHIPNLVCLQQFCSLCEMQADINIDAVRGSIPSLKTVGDLLVYLCESRP